MPALWKGSSLVREGTLWRRFSRNVTLKVFHAILLDNFHFLINSCRNASETKAWGLGTGDFQMKIRLASQKLRMTEDQQLIDYLLLLRFGTNDIYQASRPILNVFSISKIISKPLSTLRVLIKLGMESKI